MALIGVEREGDDPILSADQVGLAALIAVSLAAISLSACATSPRTTRPLAESPDHLVVCPDMAAPSCGCRVQEGLLKDCPASPAAASGEPRP